MTKEKIAFIACSPDDAEKIARFLPEPIVASMVFVGDGLEVSPSDRNAVLAALKEIAPAAQE